MVRLTEPAAAGLRNILTANRSPRDRGVKLVPVDNGGIGMTIDRAEEGDAVVDGGNRPLLIVDAAIAPQLEQAVLDVAPEAEGAAPDLPPGDTPRFVLRREPQ